MRMLRISLPLCVSLLLFQLPCLAGSARDEVDVPEAVTRAVAWLVEHQEGSGKAEWPYEGVYRVDPYEKGYEGRNQIPYGYRVGGTAIAASALLQAPGFDGDQQRQLAVERGADFVIEGMNSEWMNPDYQGGYDVRGWGYIYALDFLLRLDRSDWTAKQLASASREAIQFYIAALQDIEIPKNGGWSYSRRGALTQPSPTSPFMTGPALQALFAAKAQGFRVDKQVLERGLDALERGRMDTGEVLYSTSSSPGGAPGQLPGSVGRMLVTETTLQLAGRGSLSRIRGAIDAFLVHWEWLDARRAKNGTHIKPYYVAPYYFYYAHYYAAQAIEQLPEKERGEYRRHLQDKLFSVRMEDGMWNDRVFPRTANYGTAIALFTMTMSEAESPARWDG